MLNKIKRLYKWIKWDNYEALWGLVIGLLIAIILYLLIKIIWVSILIFIIVSLISIALLLKKGIDQYSKYYLQCNEKEQYIKPEDIKGEISKNLDNLLDLDKELNDFLDKYSSGKKNDYFETKLNKEWQAHGKDFIKRAKEILSKMSNQELLYSLLSTDKIKDIVDVFEYFKPFKINVKYLKEHPEESMKYYYKNLAQIESIKDNSINEYYYERLMDLNCFDEIEKTILSFMSNVELVELASNSTDWQEKLYFYGFIR